MVQRFIPLLALMVACSAPAADGPGSSSTGPLVLNPKAGSDAARHLSIRVDVIMTLVPVTVIDDRGRNVLGLKSTNFRIVDGSEERPISAFSLGDAPLSIVLIFDSSSSMHSKFAKARRAAAELFRHLNPEDEISLVTVSTTASVRHGFASDFRQIQDSLLFIDPSGMTPLLDGVYAGLAQMKKAHYPRKALIVVSDGGDNNSRYTLRELLSRAVEADTLIYSIGICEDPQTEEEVRGPELLEGISEATGGVEFAVRDPRDIRQAMDRIGTNLHNQYILGFYPPTGVAGGKYRKIRVDLRLPPGSPRLQVLARRGYYAPGH